MSKMSTDLVRHALNGPTMGTRWSALFHTAPGLRPGAGPSGTSGGGRRGGRADVHLEARQRPDASQCGAGWGMGGGAHPR